MTTTTIKEKLLQEIESSSEDVLREVLDFLRLIQNRNHLNPHQPIWKVAQDLMADVPPEIVAQLPRDGAEQHDHYIYGTPKHKQ